VNGDVLALGAMAAIAVAGLVRKGSRVETIPCGDCYRWAAKFALALWEEGEEAALVHATVQPPFHPRRYGHAYVEWQGRIYDWLTTENGMSKWGETAEKSWPRAEFDEVFRPEDEVRHTDAETVLLAMIREGHWGPWEEMAGPKGSRSVVAPSGYHRTAVGGNEPSVPLRHLLARYPAWVKGRVLDFGTGRGRDCRELHRHPGLEVACYDVYHPSPEVRTFPKGTFDLVIANYVVNVLPKDERKQAIQRAASKVKGGGKIVFAARGTGDVGGMRASESWQRHDDGRARFVGGQMQRFQRFFDRATLQREIGAVLGPSYSALPISQPGADTALVAFQKR